MSLKDWMAQRSVNKVDDSDSKRAVPDGVWEKCPGCKETIFKKEITKNLNVCPKCRHHFPMSAPERIFMLADKDTFVETNSELISEDPLEFTEIKPYRKTLDENIKKTNLEDAIVTGFAGINGCPVAIGVMDFSFIGGSMGSVVGEKVSRLIEDASEKKLPLIISTCSGGARMQEGIFSLMQMAKTSAAIGKYRESALPYISLLTNPTSGGVTASFATLADIMIAEPGAFIGFTGPRVIEDTIKQKLPRGFQTAEFLLQHGMIDMIVDRHEQKDRIASLLFYLTKSA